MMLPVRLPILLFVVVISLLPATKSLATETAVTPLKVAFIYENPVDAGGWSQAHEQARQTIQKLFGKRIITQAIEGVKPGADIARVMTQFARQHYDAIFATSFGYMRTVMKLAPRFPHTRFFHCVGFDKADNVGTYLTRAYQGSYMAGVLAAYQSRTGILGFVGAMPVPEVISGINAFTLGARSVNPKAVVKLVWINTWSDPVKERTAAELLMDQGVDVITHHTETNAIMLAAEQRGIYAIGYQADRSAAAPKYHLASIVHNWVPLYQHIIQQLLDHNWQPENLWYGVKQDAVRLVGLSPAIPAAAMQRLKQVRAGFVADKLKVFTGPLRDNRHQLRVAAGQAASDADIMSMNWLVDGVEGSIEHE